MKNTLVPYRVRRVSSWLNGEPPLRTVVMEVDGFWFEAISLGQVPLDTAMGVCLGGGRVLVFPPLECESS